MADRDVKKTTKKFDWGRLSPGRLREVFFPKEGNPKVWADAIFVTFVMYVLSSFIMLNPLWFLFSSSSHRAAFVFLTAVMLVCVRMLRFEDT